MMALLPTSKDHVPETEPTAAAPSEEKADALLVDMVWDLIEENEEGIDYFPDFTREQLSHVFFPEENFYLDDTGNPVFYIQPGIAAPGTAGLLTYSISIEDILDEL